MMNLNEHNEHNEHDEHIHTVNMTNAVFTSLCSHLSLSKGQRRLPAPAGAGQGSDPGFLVFLGGLDI